MNREDLHHNAGHGLLALFVGALGTITSLMPMIEQTLRILVLLLSLVATALSVWKLWRGRKDDDKGSSIPWWTMVLAVLLACILLLSACSPSGPRATPVYEPAEMVEGQTTVRGSDGQIYRLVRKGRDAGPGSVSEVDLWQPVGAAGQGLPAFTRQLQSASDTSDPIFTKAGVLE